jgi:hypothetical protein
VTSVIHDQSPAPARTSSPRLPRLPRLPALPRRRGHRWGDPAVTGLVALVVYALHGYDGVLDRDLGVFTYGGLQVAKGSPPYVDLFNSVGPLADAVPGLAIRLGQVVDADPVLSARLFFTVLSAVCCSLLCVLARDTLGSRAAGFLAPALFLTFEDFVRLASDGPREKTTMVLFLLLCLILLGRRRWALAGACAALATLTWQPVFAVTLGALVAATLLDQRDRRSRILLRFTLGGLVPSAATVVYFLAAGALTRAVDGFFVINAAYTRQPSFFSHAATTSGILLKAYDLSLFLIVGGLVAGIVLGALALPLARRPTADPLARRLAVNAAGGLVGVVWTLLVINGAPDLFVVLPFAALGLAAAAVRLLARLPRRVALTTAVAVLCLGVGAAGVQSVSTRGHMLDVQRADVDAVLATQPAGATIVSLNAPEALALAGRENPVPYQVLNQAQDRYLSATYPGGLPGFLQTLEDLHPTFVVVSQGLRETWPDQWLADDYRRVGGGAGFVWWLSRSAGPDALAAARFAHDQVMTAYGR